MVGDVFGTGSARALAAHAADLEARLGGHYLNA